jgi:hypothetical protein
MKARKLEIADTYLSLMHEHLKDVTEGRARVMPLSKISEKMHINERHLSNVVKEGTGKSQAVNLPKSQFQPIYNSV